MQYTKCKILLIAHPLEYASGGKPNRYLYFGTTSIEIPIPNQRKRFFVFLLQSVTMCTVLKNVFVPDLFRNFLTKKSYKKILLKDSQFPTSHLEAENPFELV